MGEQVKLIPDDGYRLFDRRSNKTYVEAIVEKKETKFFEAIEA